jgi:hypothetical protein
MFTILSIAMRIDNVVEGQRLRALAENEHRRADGPL